MGKSQTYNHLPFLSNHSQGIKDNIGTSDQIRIGTYFSTVQTEASYANQLSIILTKYLSSAAYKEKKVVFLFFVLLFCLFVFGSEFQRF